MNDFLTYFLLYFHDYFILSWANLENILWIEIPFLSLVIILLSIIRENIVFSSGPP